MLLAPGIFIALSTVVILFQACLIAGLPWGAASMGGRYPGKYPFKMRVVALLNIFIMSFLSIIVLSRANIILLQMNPFSHKAIWGVVVFSGVGIFLNSITPSKIERIWAPVCFIQFITSLIVALS